MNRRSSRWMRTVWPILICAGLVRVAVGLDARDAPFWSTPMVDEVAYMKMAEREMRGIHPEYGAYYMTPGYAWFLAGLRGLGAQLPQVKVVQLGLGALICGLLFLLGRDVFGDFRVGWLAALGWMFTPVVLLHELLALKPTVAVAASLGALWAMHRARGRGIWWPVAGLIAGCAVLLRGELLVVFTLLLALAGWGSRREDSRYEAAAKGSRGPWIALLCLMAVVAIPTGLNLARGGGPVVVAYSGGVNFYIGNHRGADGGYLPLRPDRSDAAVEEKDAVTLAQRDRGQLLKPSQVSRYWTQRGLQWWAERPADALALTLKKAALLWGMWEGTDVLSTDLAGRWVSLLRNPLLRSGVYLALALMGILLSWRRRELWILRGWMLAAWLVLVPFFVFERFRLPLVAVGLLFAGHTLVWSYDRLREGRWSHAAAPLLGAALLGGLLAQPGLARDETALRVNVGGMLLQQSRYDEALREFEVVRRELPGAKRIEINIATALHGLRRDDEALRSLQVAGGFLQAEAQRSGQVPVEELVYVHVLTGDILAQRGNLDAAGAEYRAAWRLRPGLAQLRQKLQSVGISPPGP